MEAKDEIYYAVKRFPGSLSDIKQTGKTYANSEDLYKKLSKVN